MDGLQFVRKQKIQDERIDLVTTEVENAKTSAPLGDKKYDNLKARLDDMDSNTLNVEKKLDAAISGLQWKESVATFGDLTTTYPNAKEGWTTSVNDTNRIYRYDEIDAEWKDISSGITIDTSKFITTDGGQTINGALTVVGGVTGDLTGNATSSDKVNNKLIINGSEYDGSAKVELELAEKVHNHGTDEINKLTGYVKGADDSALAEGDTLNEALSKLENKFDNLPAQTVYDGQNVILNGYNPVLGSQSNIEATDTVNQAFEKVENALKDHEHNYAGSQTPGGAANSAVKLEDARDIEITGAVSGTASFDGTKNITIDVTNNITVTVEKIRTKQEVTTVGHQTEVPLNTTLEVNDIVDVFLAGIRLEEGKHYTLDRGSNSIKPVGANFELNDYFNFEILRATLA